MEKCLSVIWCSVSLARWFWAEWALGWIYFILLLLLFRCGLGFIDRFIFSCVLVGRGHKVKLHYSYASWSLLGLDFGRLNAWETCLGTRENF